jgi:hypothetical protein
MRIDKWPITAKTSQSQVVAPYFLRATGVTHMPEKRLDMVTQRAKLCLALSVFKRYKVDNY